MKPRIWTAARATGHNPLIGAPAIRFRHRRTDATFHVSEPKGDLMMTGNAQASATTATREQIEDFLIAEVDPLDN